MICKSYDLANRAPEQENPALWQHYYLDTVVNVLYSGGTLPDLQDTMGHEVQDPMEHEEEDLEITLNLDSSDTEVTIFRALNEE